MEGLAWRCERLDGSGDHGPDAGDPHQTSGALILLGLRRTLRIEQLDPVPYGAQHIDQKLQTRAGGLAVSRLVVEFQNP